MSLAAERSEVTQAQRPSSNKTIIFAAALIVAVLTFLVFLPALQNGFLLWDDDVLVTENLNIRSLDIDTVKWAFTNLGMHSWHPLTFLSFAIDYSIWGMDPFGFHLTNIIFHTLNTLLVFFIILSLLRKAGREDEETGKTTIIVSFVTALLFGIHPLRVESVAWVTERKDCLYLFFSLLSILAYIKYAVNVSKEKIFYLLSLLLFSMSVMSKPMAVTLPAVLLILDYYPLGRITERFKGAAKAVMEKIPFFAISLISSFVTISADRATDSAAVLQKYSVWERLIVSMYNYIFHIYKILVPVDLVPKYPISSDVSLMSYKYLAGIALFLLITIFCIAMLKRSRLYLSVWLFFMITLLPAIGFLRVVSHANRFTYFACLGPFLLAGLLSGRAFRDSSKKGLQASVVIALLILTGLLSYRTTGQISIWKDTVTLWTHQLQFFPDDIAFPYVNRGKAYRQAGMLDEALSDYSKAVEIDPDDKMAFNNRAVVYEYMGRHKDAIDDYNTAIRLDAQYYKAYYNRGDYYEKRGEPELALQDYTKVIEIEPAYIKTYKKRAGVNASLGRVKDAIKDYEVYLGVKEGTPDIYFSLGSLHLNAGEFDKAEKGFTMAIGMKPDFLEAYGNRGTAYLNMNRHSEAVMDFSRVIELAPQSEMAYMNRGIAFMEMGKMNKAVDDMNKVIVLNPENPAAHEYLRRAYDIMDK